MKKLMLLCAVILGMVAAAPASVTITAVSRSTDSFLINVDVPSDTTFIDGFYFYILDVNGVTLGTYRVPYNIDCLAWCYIPSGTNKNVPVGIDHFSTCDSMTPTGLTLTCNTGYQIYLWNQVDGGLSNTLTLRTESCQ